MKIITLACQKGSCCPKLIINKNSVKIKDDYNGCVKLTKDQAKLLLIELENEIR